MSEERFEAWLKEHADDYHRPPAEVPRDEMWDTIAQARATRRTTHGGIQRHPVSPVRYAIAASLLIGAGIGLGYWMRGPSASAPVLVASGTTATDSALRSAVYDIASVRHLSAVEAMLTSFRSSERTDIRSSERVESDQALQRWARDLLASTRLLMDSPAGEEAGRRKLLWDLEYVLAQIVQLDPNAPAADRDMVDRAINREQVLTRIRSSIPAGFSSGT